MEPRNFAIQYEGSPFKPLRKVFRTLRKVGSKFRATYQRTTKKGERMAWLTLADGTGAIECAVFPNAYERLAETSQGQSSLREGAFLVARGRVAQQEATGSKLFIDEVQILGGTATQLSALAVAIAEQQPDEWSALGDEPGRPRWSLADSRPAAGGDLSATSCAPPDPQRDNPLAEAARRAHARQPGGRRCGDTRAGDGVLPVTASVNWGRSVTLTLTLTRSGHAHSSSNRNIGPFAAG